ncbi:MAG: response regulator transcription factor [Deltaproteobacteria bacterium]|nr:response regulator transcription factor [Deltaproteobacteria bacterium]
MRRSDEHVDGAGLSFREVEILRRVSRGDSNKVIAYDLELSVSTVATHLSQASRKLGLGPKVLVHAALVLGRLADRLDM